MFCFELTHSEDKKFKEITFGTNTEEERDGWVEVLRGHIKISGLVTSISVFVPFLRVERSKMNLAFFFFDLSDPGASYFGAPLHKVADDDGVPIIVKQSIDALLKS